MPKLGDMGATQKFLQQTSAAGSGAAPMFGPIAGLQGLGKNPNAPAKDTLPKPESTTEETKKEEAPALRKESEDNGQSLFSSSIFSSGAAETT